MTCSRLTFALVALAMCWSAGCAAHSSCSGPSGIYVDGVRLAASHSETIAAPDLPAHGVRLDIASGDVRVESTSDAPWIDVVVHEQTLGDASVHFERGRLVCTTKSGAPACAGRVVVHSNAPLARADVHTGAGDVWFVGVDVLADASVETGAGTLRVERANVGGKLVLDSGAGAIQAASVHCAELVASSGAGNIELVDVESASARVEAGVGDLELRGCKLVDVDADTGVGDVRVRDCSYSKSDFDTGVGDVLIEPKAAR